MGVIVFLSKECPHSGIVTGSSISSNSAISTLRNRAQQSLFELLVVYTRRWRGGGLRISGNLVDRAMISNRRWLLLLVLWELGGDKCSERADSYTDEPCNDCDPSSTLWVMVFLSGHATLFNYRWNKSKELISKFDNFLHVDQWRPHSSFNAYSGRHFLSKKLN